MIRVTDTLSIDERDLSFDFVRSSGPGGQNVNKVATAVQLRFDTAGWSTLDPGALDRLRRLAGRRMTGEGVVVIDARRFRSQEKNRADAIERLVSLVARATQEPRPRRATRPTKASIERRLEAKRRRSGAKRNRGWDGSE